MYARIAGTGGYLPQQVVTNFDLEKRMDTSDAWIRERTGILRRHVVAEGESTVDMAEKAARAAIEAAGLRPEDIDLIALGTVTPDLIFPNSAVLLQARLGCKRGCPAFSMEAACSGFIYSMSVADKFIRAGEAKHALVIGAESLSRITDPSDRGTAILFGDGAGAVVLSASPEAGILSTHVHADGEYRGMLYCTGGIGGGRAPGNLPPGDVIRMAGNEIFKLAVNRLGQVVDEALAANGLKQDALDWLVPHQANIRIIRATARKLDLPMARVIVTIEDHGNTSSASVPLALDVGVRDGRIRRGELLLLEAFGGGITWGAALVRY